MRGKGVERDIKGERGYRKEKYGAGAVRSGEGKRVEVSERGIGTGGGRKGVGGLGEGGG